MRFVPHGLSFASLSSVLQGQRAGGNGRIAAVAAVPGGDIWSVGVSDRPGLQADEAGGNPSPEGTPDLAAVINAAGTLGAELAPGAVVSLYGDELGPAAPVAASPTNGRFPTELEGVEVLVGGRAVPLLYVSRRQINAVLPFDLGLDPLVEVKVVRNGRASNYFEMTTAEAAPELFAAVVHADGSLNSEENPAPRGSTVSVWATGVGTLSPTPEDGAVEGTTGPYPRIDAPVSVLIGGADAVVTYAGAAPGLVAGIAQINFVIPETANGTHLVVRVGRDEDPEREARGSIAIR